MKKILIAISISTLAIIGYSARTFAQAAPTATTTNFSCSAAPTLSSYENNYGATVVVNATGTIDISTIEVGVLPQGSSGTSYDLSSSESQNSSTQRTYFFSGLSSDTPYTVEAIDSLSEKPIGEITNCDFDTTNTPAPVATTPQQIGGGTLPTAPVNTAASNTALGATSTGTTTSGSGQAVATCSAIQFTTLLNILIWAKCIIGAVIIPGIFTLAFVVFLWGVFKFIRASEDKDKQEGKQFIYMGLIGLFVMVSVWGIISIITNTFGITAAVPLLQTNYLKSGNANSSISPTGTGSGTSQ